MSTSNDCGLREIIKMYQSIVIPKTYFAKKIKIPESAKIIDNTQRDLNKAFINELPLIFDKLNIDNF